MKFTTFATAGSLLLFALAARAQEDATVTDATGVTDTQTDTGLPASGTEVTGSASEATGLPTDLSSVPESLTDTLLPPPVSGSGAASTAAGPSGPLTNPSGSAPVPPRTSPTGASGGSSRTQTQTQGAASQTASNAASPLNVGRLTAGLGAGIVVAAFL
ncbi:hypothetical protein WG66_007359 [Moniliophthora roreri]|uniref:Uncharacterized protein n=1 Tax=Moniliophthora roreri TaxID=221103 RepID=A0A0W0FNB0_MONRR|nr:hypothetical protein WG66_007359 [Moniliophthora roreri]